MSRIYYKFLFEVLYRPLLWKLAVYIFMQKQNIFYEGALFGGRNADGKFSSKVPCMVTSLHRDRTCAKSFCMRTTNRIPFESKSTGLASLKSNHNLRHGKVKGLIDATQGESYEDDDLCPVECVREFKTDAEFFKILEKSKETGSLVVVDFYRTSCGSCKYIEQGFSKLCKGSGDQEAPVIFLKHNVIDEYDEQSEVAERLKIKTVPLFHFYKNGALVEAFPTRDKERIDAAILKYTSTTSNDN